MLQDFGEPPLNNIQRALKYMLAVLILEEDSDSYPENVGDFCAPRARVPGVTAALLGDRLQEVLYPGSLVCSQKDIILIYSQTICPSGLSSLS